MLICRHNCLQLFDTFFVFRVGMSGTGLFNAMWMKSGAVSACLNTETVGILLRFCSLQVLLQIKPWGFTDNAGASRIHII
jgi:hypothetical protein